MIQLIYKNIIVAGALCMLSNTVFGQPGYETGMLDAQQKLNTAKSEQEFNAVSITFSDIAKKQKTKWLPYYYAGLSKTLSAILLKNKHADALCNEADVFIKICDSLSKNNVEVYILKSLNFSARLNVNPAARAMKYNKQIHHANETALKLDNTNPRVYLQKAQAVYYTPETFGGGAKKALPLYEEALEKFKQFKQDNNLAPNWGKDITEKMIGECKLKITTSSKK